MTQLNLARVLRLMLVTDDRLLAGRDLVEVCRAAERGGVTAVQLRLKNAAPIELVEQLRRLKAVVRVPVLVNDRLDVALAGGADGVHLGPDDVPVPLARKLAPPGFLIGASVGTEAEIPNGEQADYWGVGPYKATGTKSDAGGALGVAGVDRMIQFAAGKPCVVIGGVAPPDAPGILASGAAGIAVVSGILGEADIEVAARSYALSLQHNQVKGEE
jgi:thiamine-phosphate pyrophosphorylase